MKQLFVLLILMSAVAVEAKTANVNSPKKGTSKVSTSHDFEGQNVGGRIQSPMESLTVVENEKPIDDLIGIRKNFRDRSEKAKGLR